MVWPHGDPREVARAIAADPRFQGTTTGAPQPNLIDRFLAWLGERLGELLRAIGHVLGAQTRLNAVIGAVVLVAAAVGVVALIVWFVRRPGRGPGVARVRSVPLAEAPASAELFAQALAAARAERWHDAASLLVRAALHALDERGRLRFDPARTPGEARRVLRDAAFDAFEREATPALYAAGAATPDRFARLRAAYAAAFGERA